MLTRYVPVFFALLVGVAAAQDKAELSWTLEEGKERTEITHTITKINMTIGAQKVKTLQDQTIWTALKIVSVKGDVAQVEKTVLRVLTAIDNPQLGKFTFDTAKKDEVPEGQGGAMVAQQTLGLVGSKITYSMTARGEISDAKIGSALAGASQGMNLKQMTEQAAVTFPAELVVGQSFGSNMELEQNKIMTSVKSTYTYKGKQEGLETFALTQEMDMVPAAELPLEIKLSDQTSEGTYLFDSSQGWVKRFNVSLKLIVDFSSPRGKMQQNMETRVRTIVVDGVDSKTMPAGKPKKSTGDF